MKYQSKDGRDHSQLLYSRQVKAGSRIYYIDGKEDSRGARYIVLSELKGRDSDGNSQRHRLFIYEEDFANISDALLDVMKQLEEVEGGTRRDTQDFPRLVDEDTSEASDDANIDPIKLDW